MDQQSTIEHILTTARTIAVVGFSNKPERAGFYVPEYLQQVGYHIIPVNPTLTEGLGEKAYPDLASVPEPVDLVLVFRRSEDTPPVAQQAAQIGAKAIWLQSGIYNDEVALIAAAAGMQVVMDACMMVEHRLRS
jgi:predicted CoA-binding protein